MQSFQQEIENLREQIIDWRRDFHQHPELAFEEVRTASKVAEVLTQLGLEVQTGVGKTGVIGILEGASEGKTVLVRADMDALPIHEANSTPYISKTDGKMHACGHDAHTAIGLSLATLFTQKRDQIAGRIKFIFQPAEEIGQGAQAMIHDGALNAPAADVALGLHVWNEMPLGNVCVTDGAVMAGADAMRIVITGQGGHAAAPHQAIDPVVAAAQIINAAQTIITRNIPPIETGVISFTSIHAGDAFNVIPESVEILGTIRTYNKTIRDQIVERLEKLINGIAIGMGCTAEIDITARTIPLVNNSKVGQHLRAGFQDTYPSLTLIDDYRTMGAEDMAYFLDKVPGVFFFVGSASGEAFPHHHPRFDIDEEAMILGASLLASAVGDYVLK